MKEFLEYIDSTNKILTQHEKQTIRPFMSSKNFIGIDVNFMGEPIFVCKAPGHVIKTQSVLPDFTIVGNYKQGKLIFITIQIFDLKQAPWTIITPFFLPLDIQGNMVVGYLSFVNEVNEEILGVKLNTKFRLKKCEVPSYCSIIKPKESLEIIGVERKVLSKSKEVTKVNHFVSRYSDKNQNHMYNLAEDISKNGECDIHGHGKRLEDIVHFASREIVGMDCYCGIKYAMNPFKSTKPSEELCDELLVNKDWALFIQEKSIITKERFRLESTIDDRIETTKKRVFQASNQLVKHLRSVKEQDHNLKTSEGNMLIPSDIRGLIIVSETFHKKEFFDAYNQTLEIDPLLIKIKLNVISLQDYMCILTSSEGDIGYIKKTLDHMFHTRRERKSLGDIPCCLSLANRIQKSS